MSRIGVRGSSWIVGAVCCLGATSALASELTAPPNPQHVYGGDFVQPCGWPTTVSMQGSCTGTLVHPQVVVYAAHCGGGFSTVEFGETIRPQHVRSVPTQFCRAFPGGGTGGGNDIAFCVLSEPQNDIDIVPILAGCETSILAPGREVVVVGFGQTETGGYGDKKEVTTEVVALTGQNEILIGGGGEDSCQGDSGGPVYVRLPAEEGGDGAWRVFGITSYGGQCGQGGYYSMMHTNLQWLETESGFDLTPCFDDSGQWSPNPECGGFPLDPGVGGSSWSNGCVQGGYGEFSAVCGAPFDASDDVDAPRIEFRTPAQGEQIDPVAGESSARVSVAIDADDGDGYGVDTVELLINGQSAEGSILERPPYDYSLTLPVGTYRLDATAVDFSGNVAMAETVYLGVGMSAETPQPEGSTGDDSSGSGDDDGGTDDDGGLGDAGDTDSLPGQLGEDAEQGCGCRDGNPGRGAPLALLGLLGLRRRRR